MTLYTFKALCFSAEDKIEDSCNTFLTELNTEPCEATAENESDINLVLRKLCVSYPNNVIIGHLNINSIRNKLEMLQLLTADILIFWWYLRINLMEHFHFCNSKFMVLEPLIDLLVLRENLITRLLSRYSSTQDIEILLK